jgi:hypothetical protein
VAEQRARRHAQHVVRLPDHDARLDAVAVAEPVRGVHEVGDHVHALLLDAERGDLGEARGLDAPHRGAQRLFAAPVLDPELGSGPDLHGVGREHVDHDLDRSRVAELDQRRSAQHDALALLAHAQYKAGDRCAHVDAGAGRGAGVVRRGRVAPVRARRHQHGARGLRLVLGGGDREASGLELAPCARALEARALECLVGGGTGLAQVLGAREVALGLRERRVRERRARRGAAAGGFRPLEPRLRRGTIARVEGRRHDARDDVAHRHRVALVERDAQQTARSRRGDHEALAHARLALLVDAELERAACDAADLDRQCRRAQRPPCAEREREHGEQQAQAAAPDAHGYSRVFSTATRSSRSRRRRTIAVEASAAALTTATAKT